MDDEGKGFACDVELHDGLPATPFAVLSILDCISHNAISEQQRQKNTKRNPNKQAEIRGGVLELFNGEKI